MNNNITRKNIPSIIISKAILEELCRILDKEYEDTNGNLEYKFIGRREVLLRSNSEDFLQFYPFKHITKIEMSFKSPRKKIMIKFDFDHSHFSEFIVSGSDAEKVSDTARNVEEVFKNYATLNTPFIRNWKRALPIYVAITAVLSLPIAIFFHKSFPISQSFTNAYIIILLLMIGPSVVVWNILIKALFPIYEIPYSTKVKHRTLIIIIISIILGLVSIYLSFVV